MPVDDLALLFRRTNAMRKLLFLVTLTLLSHVAAAAPIVYDVNEMYNGAKAVGTITTDGKIGALSAADIVGFNLLLDNGFGATTTINLSTGSDAFAGNPDVEASAPASDSSRARASRVFNY